MGSGSSTSTSAHTSTPRVYVYAAAVAFRFRLVHVSGNELGERESSRPTCFPGDLIPLDDRTLILVDVDWLPEGFDVAGTLTVEVA